MIYLFFFQAEDGIRDVERSRGLGDVYKRQRYNARWFPAGIALVPSSCQRRIPANARWRLANNGTHLDSNVYPFYESCDKKNLTLVVISYKLLLNEFRNMLFCSPLRLFLSHDSYKGQTLESQCKSLSARRHRASAGIRRWLYDWTKAMPAGNQRALYLTCVI